MAKKKDKTPKAPEVEQETMGDAGKRPFERANVREIHNYTDGEGREVVELVSTFPEKPEPSIYRGLTTIVIKTVGPGGAQQPPQKMQFNFAIDAVNVQSAFDKFDASADDSIAEWQQEQKDKQRIATPPGKKGGLSLVGPDGKPLA